MSQFAPKDVTVFSLSLWLLQKIFANMNRRKAVYPVEELHWLEKRTIVWHFNCIWRLQFLRCSRCQLSSDQILYQLCKLLNDTLNLARNAWVLVSTEQLSIPVFSSSAESVPFWWVSTSPFNVFWPGLNHSQCFRRPPLTRIMTVRPQNIPKFRRKTHFILSARNWWVGMSDVE